MSKMTKRLSVALAAVLVLTLGGVAYAMIQPTLSLSAFKRNGAIVAKGTYNPVSVKKCGPKGGRSVDLFVNGGYYSSASTGRERVLLDQDREDVQGHVPGPDLRPGQDARRVRRLRDVRRRVVVDPDGSHRPAPRRRPLIHVSRRRLPRPSADDARVSRLTPWPHERLRPPHAQHLFRRHELDHRERQARARP